MQQGLWQRGRAFDSPVRVRRASAKPVRDKAPTEKACARKGMRDGEGLAQAMPPAPGDSARPCPAPQAFRFPLRAAGAGPAGSGPSGRWRRRGRARPRQSAQLFRVAGRGRRWAAVVATVTDSERRFGPAQAGSAVRRAEATAGGGPTRGRPLQRIMLAHSSRYTCIPVMAMIVAVIIVHFCAAALVSRSPSGGAPPGGHRSGISSTHPKIHPPTHP